MNVTISRTSANHFVHIPEMHVICFVVYWEMAFGTGTLVMMRVGGRDRGGTFRR